MISKSSSINLKMVLESSQFESKKEINSPSEVICSSMKTIPNINEEEESKT